jgi:hypothetical protein
MPPPPDIGLTQLEIDTIDRATKWIVMGDASPRILRSFIVSSLTDLTLADRVSSLTTAQMQALVDLLRGRRKKP